MATLVLGAAGAAIGGAVGGTILGVSAATIGGFIGSSIGSVVDSWIISSLAPTQRFEGARLDTLRITSSTEGAIIPRVYGRMRIGGNVIWATDFREEVSTTTQGGKGGGGGRVKTTTYLYYASFAVAICEGPISGIGRIWADGKPMDMEGVTWRWYPGDEAQAPDPFINARMGPGATPAYRGTAYVVFEELALEKYGNRLPQLSFEVFRPVAVPESAEGMVRAVTMIPATGEFAYSTQIVRKDRNVWGVILGGAGSKGGVSDNANSSATRADFLESLDRLQAQAPAVESVSLVVSWFGNDLRAGNCLIRPGVEMRDKNTFPHTWRVNGVTRGEAYLVSQDDGRPTYGGTPADFSVVQAIQEIRSRGLRVTLYPFVLMDVPPGNTLPNPYSHNAAVAGQPVHPWRGRITCSPAPGYAGTPDKTAAVSAQITAFFGTATPANFSVSGTTVNWTGAAGHWGYRRMILHYAHLCKAAGGVDAFLIGSELRGLTQLRRDGTGNFPAVLRLRDLADDVRGILGAGTKLSYAADWSEYSNYRPDDGSGDVFFHMDSLWASPSIDFIGIDNYMPISDWRDGHEHLDAQAAPAIYDRAYLQANIEGGEGFDWYYASGIDRAAQVRTPITDGAGGAPWVFRTKDLRSWWANPHRNRPGGSPAGGTLTAWVPESKPIWFTEFGCPAVDRGANQPNVFYDPKSSESFVPHFSRGWRDDAMQRAYLEATLDYWRRLSNNPVSSVYTEKMPYGNRMVQVHECAAWTWDARPYPFFPALDDVWADGENWRLGHWLTGRLGAVSLQALVRELCLRAGLPADRIDVTGLWGAVEGYVITALESPRSSITTLARHFGFDAVESGGLIRFKMRGGAPVAMIAPEDMVAAADARGEAFELTRGQETELPQALKWQMARADEEYDAGVVEARRITVDASRVTAETFPVAVPPEEADRRCRRALMEAWVGRETAVFRLPPSRLAVDPGDVLTLMHDGRAMDLRVVSVADAEARSVEAILQDQAVYDLPPGAVRAASLSRPVIFGGSEVIIMDLPQLVEEMPEHWPMVAAYAAPWPGEMAVFRSLSDDGFTMLGSFDTRARIGVLATPLAAGPYSRFDMGNELLVDMVSGSLESVTDYALFGGANTLAVESAPDQWEIVQASRAELVATGRYRLTRLLRGQRGTEHAIAASVPAGARVVVLDTLIAPLAIASSDIGRPWNWRIGPASLPYTDDAYAAATFTPQGAGLRPFSVSHVEQPRLRGRTPGNLTIRWTRRDRSLVSDSWDLDEVPMSESSESYAIDILDGAAVKRTLTSTTTSVVYTSAQQSADWGALLSPGATLRVRIAQLSATRGRGTARTATLMF